MRARPAERWPRSRTDPGLIRPLWVLVCFQIDEEYKQAAQFYAHALAANPHNAYAANGLGVLLAEKGHFLQARETFVQVREANPDDLDVWINLAHANLELGVFASAIKLVRRCATASAQGLGRNPPLTSRGLPGKKHHSTRAP